MRHIPEDELHAYLDQALSRSQCVEIETHLAECAPCRASRDSIAALRDQTTSLLGSLRPPRRMRPSYEALANRAAERSARRRDQRRLAVWAASLLAALGLGYALRAELGVRSATTTAVRPEPAISAPAPSFANGLTPRQAPSVTAPAVVVTREADAKQPAGPPAVGGRAPEPLAAELSTDALAPEEERLDGVWRTVPWSDAPNDETGIPPARVAGLPVVQVQVQSPKSAAGGSVMVVAQQLSSGEVIRTIEGPAADVSKLLTRRGDDAAVLDSFGGPAVTLQRGDRMIAVTGQIPSDSLQAMIRRMNAARRTRP